MANEITAEMLAREMCRVNGEHPDQNVWDDNNNLVPCASENMDFARSFLLAAHAHASLQAERAKPMIRDKAADWDMRHPPKDAPPTWGEVTWAQSTGIEYLGNTVTSEAKDAPERVRCWMAEFGGVTHSPTTAEYWRASAYTVTEGYFTAKGSIDD